MNVPLEEEDPELFNLIEQEKYRQYSCLELIASENFTSQAVLEANASVLTNKYSEGLPGARYYGGNEVIDQVENLCRQRALQAFRLNPDVWGVNVQPYSGTPANFSVYTALLQPHDRMMGLNLPSGGHLSHGYQTAKKKISGTSIYFETLPYQVDPNTGYVDMGLLEQQAKWFRPKLIVCGASAYPRDWDYARFQAIARSVDSLLMVDMAHISGLVAAQEQNDPFAYADVVTTTTHKSLRGPRAGLIFYKREFEDKVNMAVFPGNQGGPHNHTVGAIAVALKQVNTPEFRRYAQQVKKNAHALAEALIHHGYRVVSGGTENHSLLLDVRPLGLTGNKLEYVCDRCHLTVNKNTIHGDVSAFSPGGIRLGTPALTSRSMKEVDFEKIAEFLHQAIQITCAVQSKTEGKLMKDFVTSLNAGIEKEAIEKLKSDVIQFAQAYPMPGFDPQTIQLNKKCEK